MKRKNRKKKKEANVKKILISLAAALLILSACSEKESEGLDYKNMAYYKNIPEVEGKTFDEEPYFYAVKINVGYERTDKVTQGLLNSSKTVLIDRIRAYFSLKNQDFMSFENEAQIKEDLKNIIFDELKNYDKRVDILDIAIIKMIAFPL